MAIEQRRSIGYLSLALLGLAFIAAIVASNTLLGGIRLDLTENRLYTLSAGTRALLGRIEEPVNLYFFFSERGASDIPALRQYATRVTEMLEEFAAVAGDQVVLQQLDPVQFSEEEDRAAQFGLQPIGVGNRGDDIYFGLAATNSVGDQAIIAAFRSDREAFLEYDLATLIYSLANPDKVVVGLIDGASMAGGFDMQTQQPREPWVITQQARQLFDVRTLPATLETIEADVDVLWIVHPTELDEPTLYAIDQFVLGGGRALVFVDPYLEIAAAGAMPGMPGATTSSNLERLFTAWGIDFAADEVVLDNVHGLTLGGGLRPIRHIALLGLDGSVMDQGDVVTSGLNTVNVGMAGYFTPRDGSTLTFTPLLQSSGEAAAVPAARLQFLSDPSGLLNDFVPRGEPFVLAARLEGSISSAFPDGRPAASAADAGTDTGAGEGAAVGEHIAVTDNANVIVVGDVDVLSDRLWVSVQNFLGQRLMTSFANNGDLVVNALDNLSGSADLIGLRSRATYTRPFTKVEELRRDADARFRQTEQRLEAELAETERNLAELQAARDDQSSLLMSPEQQAEVERFLAEQVRIRQELRAVRRELDRSIEGLGLALKAINIGLVPLLLTLGVVAYSVANRRRRARR